MRRAKRTPTDTTERKPSSSLSTRFTKSVFSVTPFPSRKRTPWKLEIRASFAGRKVRRFCGTEAEAWTLGAQLVDAIRSHGLSSLETQRAGLPMQSACAAFEAQQKGMSLSHTNKTAQICRMLREAFPVVEVTPAEISAWFAKLPGSETTRAMYYRYVRMFFRWAKKMRFVESDPSEVLRAPKAAVGRNFLTPAKMSELLGAEMPAWMRACLLLGAFAGIRTEELMRMEWQDIDTEAGTVEVRPGVMKDSGGFLERIVDFTAPLEKRKAELKGEGKLVPIRQRDFHHLRDAIVAKLKWPGWPDNCLRHSFATYHLAESKNAGKTAYQMGHTSPSMVLRVYAVPARKADAAAWWAI